MSDAVSTQVQLVSRPTGWPEPGNFTTVTVDLGDLQPGEVRVRNEFISVDPYMRGRMNEGRSYVPPFSLNERITGGAVGRVVESASDELAVGTAVLHQHGWSDTVQADASTFKPLPEIDGAPLSLYLHIFGMTGLTAYVGLKRIAQLREGDTVFVSGAAGAVGTAAGQLARLLGAGRVIGSAGSAEKVQLLTQKYGYDAAFNYKDGDVAQLLQEAAPEGIDVFFDNVGADHLEAAIGAFNDHGRAAICGSIASYNATEPTPGPRNMGYIVARKLLLQGFIVGDHWDMAEEFQQTMAEWFAAGRIAYDETVVDGVENTVDAFLDMMRGGNTGKMLVRVS
jgi:NADPH-dependent curcumin reductase CurA